MTTWKPSARPKSTGCAAAWARFRPNRSLPSRRLTRGIVNKIMHTPVSTLKTAARESEATTVVDLVRRLFNLAGKESR